MLNSLGDPSIIAYAAPPCFALPYPPHPLPSSRGGVRGKG